jgi:hypothetical protein
MLDKQGFVTESHGAHVCIVNNGTVYTPKTEACQEGITRQTVVDLCRDHDIPCEEKNISLTEVYRADEMFCTGTMGELAPVVEVDGRTIGDGEKGGDDPPFNLPVSGSYPGTWRADCWDGIVLKAFDVVHPSDPSRSTWQKRNVYTE